MLGPERHRLVIETQTRPAESTTTTWHQSIGNREGVTFLWILVAISISYVACWVYFGLATFRRGHCWLFRVAFIFPILWIIGAFIAPTERAAARAAAAVSARDRTTNLANGPRRKRWTLAFNPGW